MLAEIITIGDEILIGQIVDTNSAYISKELSKVGVKVHQITSIQDDKSHILESLSKAQKNVDLVLLTGGLGPTKDDITKHTLCEYFEDHLIENPDVLSHIYALFSEYFNREPLPDNKLQAMVPSKALVLQNNHGTAPALWLEKENTVFVSMPGVPYEMKHLMQDAVLPNVVKRFKRPFIYHKTLLTYGEGESRIAKIIEDWEDNLPSDIKLAYLPALGKVRLRLSSTGLDEALLKEKVDAQMEVLSMLLSDIAVGFEDETSIERRIGELLREREQFLSAAESCTGGAIASQITANAGSSAYFKGGIVPYETRLKVTVLGVNERYINEHSVVSIPVVEEMARCSNELFGSDYALATTGIAGPSKGDGSGEVGTVCIAIATPEGVVSEKFNFGKSRNRVISKAINKAFEMLLKEILKN
jgi:nicotinamide-nucleotide amidase